MVRAGRIASCFRKDSMARTLVYLTPQYFHDDSVIGGGERYPINLAIAVAASGGSEFAVELVSFGPRAARVTLHRGVSLRVLAVARPPKHSLDALSWELPEVLANAALVHIFQPFTRASQVALLLARQFRK